MGGLFPSSQTEPLHSVLLGFFFFFFFNKAQKFVTIIETKENKGEEGEGREGERKGGKTSGRRDVLHRGSDLYTALDLLRSAKLQREAVEWSGGV